MTALRVVILGLAFALGTVWVGWWSVPLLAAGYGAIWRGTARPGLLAAAAAALAWGGWLAILQLGGAPVAAFGARLAGAMGVPSFVPHVATVLFPAVLAGPAAYIAARAGRADPGRRKP